MIRCTIIYRFHPKFTTIFDSGLGAHRPPSVSSLIMEQRRAEAVPLVVIFTEDQKRRKFLSCVIVYYLFTI